MGDITINQNQEPGEEKEENREEQEQAENDAPVFNPTSSSDPDQNPGAANNSP